MNFIPRFLVVFGLVSLAPARSQGAPGLPQKSVKKSPAPRAQRVPASTDQVSLDLGSVCSNAEALPTSSDIVPPNPETQLPMPSTEVCFRMGMARTALKLLVVSHRAQIGHKQQNDPAYGLSAAGKSDAAFLARIEQQLFNVAILSRFCSTYGSMNDLTPGFVQPTLPPSLVVTVDDRKALASAIDRVRSEIDQVMASVSSDPLCKPGDLNWPELGSH